MTIFANFLCEKMAMFWQYFDTQMAIFRRVSSNPVKVTEMIPCEKISRLIEYDVNSSECYFILTRYIDLQI